MSNEELFQKVSEISKNAPEERSSYFQLKYFVLGKEPTTQGQLWRCLKEIQTGKETIENIEMQIADTEDDLLLLTEKINETTNEIELRKLKRRKESILKSLNKLERSLKYKTQEVRFFVQAYESLLKIEPLKDYDDFEAQKEYWETKIAEEINFRILMQQPLSVEIIKMALALPEDSRIKSQIISVMEVQKSKLLLGMKKEDND